MADTTLNLRKVDADAVARAKRAAAARGLTVGRYFERIVALHDIARAIADEPGFRDTYVAAELQERLRELGLETLET